MAPPAIARAKIEAAGIEWILEQFEDGRSFRSIASELGVNQMSLHGYLRDNPIHSARLDQAMIAGAERYEEEAIQVLRETYEKLDTDEPHPNGGALATLARERAQAAWRQASVRDPRRYSDRRTSSDVNITIKRDVTMLPTAELEALVQQQRQTLELQHDGQVTGGTSDSDDGGV